MASNKKSVLLYCDIIHTVEELNDEEAGKLFKHYLRYINDLNPEAPDKLTQIVFEPIKQNLKRDLKKWESIISKRSEAGLASAKKRQQNSTSVNTSQQVSTVTDTVTVKDNVKEIKDNIDSRKLKFADTLKPFVEKYGAKMIRSFYDYWVEPNKSNTKFRQELQKTWDVKRRLEAWSSNDKNFNKETTQETPTKLTYSINKNG